MKTLRELADSLQCLETVDKNEFQCRARTLQAIWRIEHGLPVGEQSSKPRGAMLAMPWAQETLANFLTEDTRQRVREILAGADRQSGSLIHPGRMVSNLLSSQPMAFNLFVPLERDLGLASKVFAHLLPGRVARVTRIAYEFSPGRGEMRYTDDHSAFDVCVWFDTPRGTTGFVGIEVKYHENLSEQAGRHRPRYDDVAATMACFKPTSLPELRHRPLQQIWRDHMLAGAYRAVDEFEEGVFAYLYPAANQACANAVTAYTSHLTSLETFFDWTLEAFTNCVSSYTDESWIDAFVDRYLAFEKIEARLSPVQ